MLDDDYWSDSAPAGDSGTSTGGCGATGRCSKVWFRNLQRVPARGVIASPLITMTRGDVDSENGPGTMDSLSDAAAGEELARNFSVVTKLKDERIARLVRHMHARGNALL